MPSKIISRLEYRTFIIDRNPAYTEDADIFINKGLQEVQCLQREAVAEAMLGNFGHLDDVRKNRSSCDFKDSSVVTESLTPTLRLYRPITNDGKIRPLLLYLHGGGWCFGSIQSCSRFCTELTLKTDMLVIALDYSLSPENKFPKALDDCISALTFIMRNHKELNTDIGKISIGGDSAGGNLAISTIIKSGFPFHSLLLFYPVVQSLPPFGESWKEYADGYGLNSDIMRLFLKTYIGREDPANILISPISMSRCNLMRLPRTMIISGDRDILYSQGKHFANVLDAASVPVTHVTLKGAVHLFITVQGQESAFHKSLLLSADFLSR